MSEVHPDPTTKAPKQQQQQQQQQQPPAVSTTPASNAAAASSYSLGGWVSWAQQTTSSLIAQAQAIDPNQVKARASDILVKAQEKTSDIIVKAQGQAATLVVQAQQLNTTQVRHYMSGSIVRYQQDGFDLDLAYITDQIIAMGLPSEGVVESMYRNPIDDVVRFFETKHTLKLVKVFNLCEERSYNYDKFNNQVAEFRIKEQDVCQLQVIHQFCVSASSWLLANPTNIVAVHCNSGSGRSGMMVCCLLQYMQSVTSADEAIRQFVMKRAASESPSPLSLMNASQLRYVRYFGDALSQNAVSRVPTPTIYINEIEIAPVIGGAYPALIITNNGSTVAHIRDPDCHVGEEEGLVLQLAGIGVMGDVHLTLMDMGVIYDAEMMSIHFHTNFVGRSGVTRFVRDECVIPGGEKALKRFSEAFLVEVRWSTQRIAPKRVPKPQQAPSRAPQPTNTAATPNTETASFPSPPTTAVTTTAAANRNSSDATHEIYLNDPPSITTQPTPQLSASVPVSSFSQSTSPPSAQTSAPALYSTSSSTAPPLYSTLQDSSITPAQHESTPPVPDLTSARADNDQRTQSELDLAAAEAETNDLFDQNLDLDLSSIDEVFKNNDLKMDDIDALVGDVLGSWVDDDTTGQGNDK